MRFRTAFTHLALLPLSACTRSCNDYDNNEEFARAQLPAYTETGAYTLGCMLGAQTWTVLGQHEAHGIGGPYWQPNQVQTDGGFAVPPHVEVSGQMSGVRNNKTFYDVQIGLAFWPSDTLGGLRLLGADTSRTYSGRFFEQMSAHDFVTSQDYSSRFRRPVHLFVRKLNRQQRIVSGTFEGMLYNSTDSLAVTNGRFDVRY